MVLHCGSNDDDDLSVFMFQSVLTRSRTPMAEMQSETMTEYQPCATDGCRHSMVCPSPDILKHSESKTSNLNSSLHKTCSRWFSVQFLCNLAYLSLFSLISFLLYSLNSVSNEASVNSAWINWRTSIFHVFAGFFSWYLKDMTLVFIDSTKYICEMLLVMKW